MKSPAPNVAIPLRVDWCSYAATKYAVENWHYSKRMPTSKMARLGVWEDGKFIGAIVFGMGANNKMLVKYKLPPTAGCELERVALKEHETPVTRIISIAIKMLKREMPGLKLIVSYADPEQGHVGTIYQAGNWIYDGQTDAHSSVRINGELRHARVVSHMIKDGRLKDRSQLVWVKNKPKYRYLYPLDKETYDRIQLLKKPYPAPIM